MGLFIIASNDISLSPEEMLKCYRGQDKVEKGFRFLKDDTFSVSKVYLKNNSRIEALTMIVVLCLMFYSIAEWRLKTKLEQENETVPDQKGNLRKDLQWFGYFSISRELQNFLLNKKEKWSWK